MPRAIESQKIMFEIYRETPREGRYRVVYFTELDENTTKKKKLTTPCAATTSSTASSATTTRKKPSAQ